MQPSNTNIYFIISIKQKLFKALFDSGSGISVIHPIIVKALKLEISESKRMNIRLVNRSIINLRKTVTIPIVYEGSEIDQTFYLLENAYDIILGLDFYNSASLKIVSDNQFEDDPSEDEQLFARMDVRQYLDNCELLFPKYMDGNKELIDDKARQQIGIMMSIPAQTDTTRIIIYNNDYDHDYTTDDEYTDFLLMSEEAEINFDNYQFHIGTEDSDEMKNILILLEEFRHLFAFNIKDLKSAKGVTHKIETGDAKPIKQRNYRYGYKEKDEITKQVSEMLEGGIIEECNSSWINPIVLVHQKDKYRFCLDYRKLNEVTKPDCFPLPIIEDLLDQLEGNPIMSIFDLRSGFFQIEVEIEDREKTAFTANGSVYRFKKMPFGLINAPTTFQRFMQNVLSGILNKFVNVYIDDVVIYSKTVEEHLDHLRQVFERLDKHDLRLHPEKCKFLCKEIKFLGFVVSRRGIMPDPQRAKAINDFKRPEKVKDIRSFIGMANYYRKYIQNFATLAQPLNRLIRKDVKWNWDEKCEDSFLKIKETLSNPPILAHYVREAPLTLYTDASGYGLGAILTQIHNDQERTLQYASCTLNKHQENYSVSEKECLAIVWAVDKFRHYLLGVEFTIKTDHCGLCWLMRITDPSGKLARWALRLQEYKFKIVYKNGKAHTNVDPLSRYPIQTPAEDCDEIPMLLNEIIDLSEEQSKDSWCKYIKTKLSNNKLKSSEDYRIEDGILVRKMYDSKGIERTLVCLPQNLRQDVLFSLHSERTSGHLGFIKTLYKVKERFYFPKIEKYVRKFVRSCQDCQSRKRDHGLYKGNLQNISSTQPFELVGMDILGPLTKTYKDNKWIIILVDHFTKYVEAQAVKDATAETVAEFFIMSGVLRHGAIKKCITDRAKNFCANFTNAVLEAFRIKHILTSAYHPETNGLAEKQCKTITDMLALYCRSNQRDWDLFLPYLIFAYNTARQDTTQYSPFYLVHGREAKLPIDICLNLPSSYKIIDDVETRLLDARELVRQSVLEAQRRQKKNYDKKHRDVQFEIGQKVLVYTKTRKVGLSEKLLNCFHGPFEVIQQITPVTYLMEDVRTKKQMQAHINRIKPYYQDDLDFNDSDIWVLDHKPPGDEERTQVDITDTVDKTDEDDHESTQL